MNIFEDRFAKFRQELAPILLVSILSVVWAFKAPFILRLAAPWGTILAVTSSLIGIACTVLLFTFADKLAPFMRLQHLDAHPYGQMIKIGQIITYAIIVLELFFMWYKDLWHMSNLHYAFVYGFMALIFASFYNAMNREPGE